MFVARCLSEQLLAMGAQRELPALALLPQFIRDQEG